MNHIDSSGSYVLENATNTRNLKREAIIPTEEVNWWHFLQEIGVPKCLSKVISKQGNKINRH